MRGSFLLVFVFGFFTFSQAPIDVGIHQLNSGLGFARGGLALYGGYDYTVAENVTVGGAISYGSYSRTQSIFIIGLNANYHFNRLLKLNPNWNFYLGPGVNYYFYSAEEGVNHSLPGSESNFQIQIGGRYYFYENLGVNISFMGGGFYSGVLGITYVLKQ